MQNPTSRDTVKELQRLKLVAVLSEGQHWVLSSPHASVPSKEWGGKRPPQRLTITSLELRSRAVMAKGWDGPIDPEHFVRGTFFLEREATKGKPVFAYRRLPALTIHQPWAWAIMQEGEDRKDCENRNWKPPSSLLGKWMWVHAGKHVSKAGVLEVRARGLKMPEPDMLPVGAVLGAVQLHKVVDRYPTSRWFTGPWGWVLEHPRSLPEPIPMRGQQRLWAPNFHAPEA